MRTFTGTAALALALTLGMRGGNEAKAQFIRVGIGTGYNTAYVPGYPSPYRYSYPGYYGSPPVGVYRPYYVSYPGYGSRYYGGTSIAVTTPQFSFSYGTPGYGYGGYHSYRGYHGHGRRWR